MLPPDGRNPAINPQVNTPPARSESTERGERSDLTGALWSSMDG